MKWKVENLVSKSVIYLDPNDISLTLVNCTLHNNRNRSEEIFLGSNKSVCAWVICEKILVDVPSEGKGDHIRYNPRVAPHWSLNGKDVDGAKYNELKTNGKDLYANYQ